MNQKQERNWHRQKRHKHQRIRINRRTIFLSLLTLSIANQNCEGKPSPSPATATAVANRKRTSSSSRVNASLQEQKHLQSLPKIAPLLGESAIIDKETGRVYWQGGEQSLFHSTVGHTYFKDKPGLARNVRSTLYSCILWMSAIRFLAKKVLPTTISSSSLQHWDEMNNLLSMSIRGVIKFANWILKAFLICLACLPCFSRSFLIVIGVFYFIESYTCSTRQYLDNGFTSDAADNYLVSFNLLQARCIYHVCMC